MRGVCLILVLAAGLQATGCTDTNPRYRPGVVTDAGGGTGGSDASPTVDGPSQVDTESFDQPPAIDAETTFDVAYLDGPDPDGPVVFQDAADASPDAFVRLDAAPDLPSDAFVPPAGCGLMTTNVSGISNADGVVVDTDGIIYTLTDDSKDSFVGKIPPGGAADVDWLTVFDSPTTWGLALDSPGHNLYVLVVSGTGAVVRYQDIKGSAMGDQIYSDVDDGNDVAVGPDGHVYYTQLGDGFVYAVTPGTKTRRRVSNTRVGSTTQAPAALTFDPGGRLLVGTQEGPIFRLTLTGGVESGREQLTGWSGWANGMAHDRAGRLYVAQYHDTEPRSIVRLNITGNTVTGSTTIATGGRFSSIAFGRGPLDCRDLYVADPWGPMRRVRVMDSL
jgi:hypothetical protein